MAAWVAGGLVLFASSLRVSFGERVDSDGANSALQAWDLVHGHLMLHGWLMGDATFYAFELPLNGIVQLLFGVGTLAAHISSALTYLIVAACAVALAVTSSRGPARAVRCAVAVAVLAAPLLAGPPVLALLEEPDHIGTSLFLLLSFLLIDRVPDRPFTAPLVCLILCAGQLSDLTVRYVAVPTVVLICGYRVLAARKLRSGDTALVVAAVMSVPLELVLQAAMVHLGAFLTALPQTRLSPPGLWPRHASLTWLNVRVLFGSVAAPDTKLGGAGAAFGLICLLAVLFGLARVIWTWRRASRAEQLLVAAIVFNVGTYLISAMPSPGRYGSPVGEAEHLFLAMLHDGGWPVSVISDLVDLGQAEAAVLSILNSPGYSHPPPPRFPARAGDVRMCGAQIALELDDSYLGVEHAFLAMIRHRETVPARALAGLADLDALEAAVLEVKNAPAGSPPEEAVFLPEGQEMDGPLRKAIVDALPEGTTFGFNHGGDERTWMHVIGPDGDLGPEVTRQVLNTALVSLGRPGIGS